MTARNLSLFWMLAALGGPANAAEGTVLLRNYLIHNDVRDAAASDDGLAREWAQGVIVDYRSDPTPGTVGVALDLHGFVGVKLDGGHGHAGTGLLPLDSDGDNRNDYSSAGGAVRLVHGDRSLSYGEMTVETPVFDTADKRLQPEYATGWLFHDQSLPGLLFQAGRFTAFKNQNASSSRGEFTGYGASTQFGGISLAGLTWAPAGTPWRADLYASQLDDVWRQAYLGLGATHGPWALEAQLYHTRDQGRARAGALDTLAYSVLGTLSLGAHALSIGYQKIEGATPFDFVGGDSIYLANSAKYADFNGPGERSWQARYRWQGLGVGLPGLSASLRYVRGSNIDGTHAPAGGAYNPLDPATGSYQPQQANGGAHWERDIDLSYVVQSGTAKGLSVSAAHVSHRANDAQRGTDLDRLYLVIEYPLDLAD